MYRRGDRVRLIPEVQEMYPEIGVGIVKRVENIHKLHCLIKFDGVKDILNVWVERIEKLHTIRK